MDGKAETRLDINVLPGGALWLFVDVIVLLSVPVD
jgi:hypothetical protein